MALCLRERAMYCVAATRYLSMKLSPECFTDIVLSSADYDYLRYIVNHSIH